ncbi:hypothetical protein D6833_06815 [Candidatus Parcubacteria bacterium]|nr:MAG: hypothetical protein D6833_06815 [Candidatus Parcubacteria bacterium]
MSSWTSQMMERTINAVEMGRLEGENDRLGNALHSWKQYARELERKVNEYQRKAYSGWAMWGAARAYVKEKYGEDLHYNEEIDKGADERFADPEFRKKIEAMS